MVNLNFRCDNEFFQKLRKHKFELEMEQAKKMSWEQYLRILFGMSVEA